jgi:hypothetical protein
MKERGQVATPVIRVQATVISPAQRALNPIAPQRIYLSAVLDLHATRPRIAPEIASVLDVKLEHLEWVSQLPCASIWIELFGRGGYYWVIADPSVEGPELHRLVLDNFDLVIDGDPPAVRVRRAEYIVEI